MSIASLLVEMPAGYDSRRAFLLVFDFPASRTRMSRGRLHRDGPADGTRFHRRDSRCTRAPRAPVERVRATGPGRRFGFVHTLVADLEQRLCIDREPLCTPRGTRTVPPCRVPRLPRPHFAAVAMVLGDHARQLHRRHRAVGAPTAGTADLGVPYPAARSPGRPSRSRPRTTMHRTPTRPVREAGRSATLRAGVSELRYAGSRGARRSSSTRSPAAVTPGRADRPRRSTRPTPPRARRLAATERILTFFAAHHRPPFG